jgi:hypothetical protein
VASRFKRNLFNGTQWLIFLLACRRRPPHANCQNYPPSSSSLFFQHGRSASKQNRRARRSRGEEGGYELDLVEADDVGVLEQLQRRDLPLDLQPSGRLYISMYVIDRPELEKQIKKGRNRSNTHAPGRGSSWRGCAGGRGS